MGVRESSVSHFCPLSCSSNFTPSTPPHYPHLTPSGSQFSPGGSGAASSLSGGQEAQGPLHRQQVGSDHKEAILRSDTPVTTAATCTTVTL